MITDQPTRIDYWKSLLKIEVPVSVTLASRSMPVGKIINITPGMMIQFEKNCEMPMTVEVDDHPIAECEVVKVGDRFGVKVTSVLQRPEHWIPIMKAGSGS
jgi:flagellar motor switch protein FliN